MKLSLRMTEYQLAVARRLLDVTAEVSTLDELVALAVDFDAARPREPRWSRPRPPARRRSRPRADARLDAALGAASADAIVLAAGETLRIEQIGDGQCVDLDAHELGGLGRPFSAARTRAQHGIHPTLGAMLWSSPPEVPLLEIVADTAPPHDLCFPACTPFEYELVTGIPGHASCSQLHALARRRYGLPDDPRADVLNIWLPTEIDPDGGLRSWPVACRRGDYIELRALIDVVVVTSTCPDDVFGSSQYEPGPVRVIAYGGGGRCRMREPTESPPVGRGTEVIVELPDALRSHLDAVCAHGWLGYAPAAVARALLFRFVEAISPPGPERARSTRAPS
jgi:uncharacterized protein YcgI (DUF1989 family)